MFLRPAAARGVGAHKNQWRCARNTGGSHLRESEQHGVANAKGNSAKLKVDALLVSSTDSDTCCGIGVCMSSEKARLFGTQRRFFRLSFACFFRQWQDCGGNVLRASGQRDRIETQPSAAERRGDPSGSGRKIVWLPHMNLGRGRCRGGEERGRGRPSTSALKGGAAAKAL